MKKLLIATQSCCSSDLERIMDDCWDVHVCTDGYATINTMKYLQPEALVLSLNIPKKDGLAVLEECFPNIPPITLALSPMINDYIAQTCLSLGVKYLMPIPSSAEDIRSRLENICLSLQDQPTATMQHLRVLKFNQNLDGYRYLLTAVPFFALDPARLLHKEVYTYVVEQCAANDIQCVERSIRGAIQDAWDRRAEATWENYFSMERLQENKCPTNKEFIRALAVKL